MKPLLFAAHLCDAAYSMTVPSSMGIVAQEAVRHAATCTQGMIYTTDDHVWIAFAGTNERKDWLSNFKIIKKNCFGWLPAHKGFSECAEAVIDQCLKAVSRWPGKRVTVTGHSLGGAIALLVAIGIQARVNMMERGAHVRCITFGQPRVSNKSLIRSALPGEYVRVQNGSDIVCRVPKLGYSHAGKCLYLRNGDGYCMDPGHVERFLDRLLTLNQHQRVGDHMMPDYIRQLQRVL